MRTNSLVYDFEEMLADAMLVAITPAYKYVGGNRTDVVDGYRYHLVLPNCNYDTVAIKIAGECKLENPKQPIRVRIVNPKLRIYAMNGNVGIAMSADDIVALTAATATK